MWAATVRVGWAVSAAVTISRQTDVSVSVNRSAGGVGDRCDSPHLGVICITQIVLLVGGVESLPRVRATYAVVFGRCLDRDECVVHILVTVADLGVILPRSHACCAEEAIRTLGAVAVCSRSLAVVPCSTPATSGGHLVRLGERSVTNTVPVR